MRGFLLFVEFLWVNLLSKNKEGIFFVVWLKGIFLLFKALAVYLQDFLFEEGWDLFSVLWMGHLKGDSVDSLIFVNHKNEYSNNIL